jgi:hypothetical protein
MRQARDRGNNMLLSTLPLCLLLQTLQYCTASTVNCQDLVERLNRDTCKAADEIGASWKSCRSEFFKRASGSGISSFFKVLKVREPRSLALPAFIAQDIANETTFASRVNVNQLKILIARGAIIPPKFFANVLYIDAFNSYGIEGLELPDDLLEEYDGLMKDTSWITGEQFRVFGSKLNKEILCTNLRFPSNSIGILHSISSECLRGLLRNMILEEGCWHWIPLDIIGQWIYNFEEDLQHIAPNNFLTFPTRVWESILKSMVTSNAFDVTLKKVSHAKYLELQPLIQGILDLREQHRLKIKFIEDV